MLTHHVSVTLSDSKVRVKVALGRIGHPLECCIKIDAYLARWSQQGSLSLLPMQASLAEQSKAVDALRQACLPVLSC